MLDRRSLLKTAAWSAPVIAIAVAAPAFAASAALPPKTPSDIPGKGPNPPAQCGGASGDNGTYFVYDDRIEISYARVSERMADVNVQWADGSKLNWHLDNYPAPNMNDPKFTREPTVPVISADGKSLVIYFPKAVRPIWVQVHGFNSHYGREC